MHRTYFFARIVLVIFSGISCKQSPQYNNISEKEAIAFGRKIEWAFQNEQFKKLDGITSQAAFADQIAYYAFADAPDEKMQELSASISIAEILIETRRAGDHYRFLRTYEKDGRRYLRFRSYGTNGFNYHDYLLCKKGKNIFIADCFMFKMGETLAKTLWDESKFIEGKDGAVSEQKAYYQQLKKALERYTRMGEYSTAIEAYQKFPVNLKTKKVILITAFEAAIGLNDTALLNSLYTTYITNHHTITDSLFHSVNYTFYNGNYEQTRNAIDGIDSLVGGDEWLCYYRGVISILEGDAENAQAALLRSLEVEHEFGMTHYWLAYIYAAQGNYEESKKYLNLFRKSMEFDGAAEQNLINTFPALDTR